MSGGTADGSAARDWRRACQISTDGPVTALACGDDGRLLCAVAGNTSHLLDADGRRIPAPFDYVGGLAIVREVIVAIGQDTTRALSTLPLVSGRPGARWTTQPAALQTGALVRDSANALVVLELSWPNCAVSVIDGRSFGVVERFAFASLREPSPSIALTHLERGEDFLLITQRGAQLTCVSRKGRLWWAHALDAEGLAVATGPRGEIALALGADRSCSTILILDSVGMDTTERIQVPFRVSALCFAPDGLLWAGSADRGVCGFRGTNIPTSAGTTAGTAAKGGKQ